MNSDLKLKVCKLINIQLENFAPADWTETKEETALCGAKNLLDLLLGLQIWLFLFPISTSDPNGTKETNTVTSSDVCLSY